MATGSGLTIVSSPMMLVCPDMPLIINAQAIRGSNKEVDEGMVEDVDNLELDWKLYLN